MSEEDKIVRINGEVVPPNKRGKKIKLYAIMSAEEIERRLLAARSTETATPKQLLEEIEEIRKKAPKKSAAKKAELLRQLNKNPGRKTRRERGLV